MKLELNWEVGFYAEPGKKPQRFVPATVPGAVQLDWARAEGWEPYWQADNYQQYRWMEDVYWTYSTRLPAFSITSDQKIFLVGLGIDYKFDVELNDHNLYSQEGMFTGFEIDLTDQAQIGDELKITIHPAPKSHTDADNRAQADHSCKPAVSYGWDFHPRLIPLGIWGDLFLDIRPETHLRRVEFDYTLAEDLQSAALRLSAETSKPGAVRWILTAPDGEECWQTQTTSTADGIATATCLLDKPALWWPHDHGAPALYQLQTQLLDSAQQIIDTRIQRIGFRRIRLVMAEGQWDWPDQFPKPRSHPPMTLEINGRRIFAKGANWVSPHIFPGLLDKKLYASQLNHVKNANMNLLRLWGGAPAQKESFYDLCDELGILVWQEFPLACNAYPDDDSYLRVLEQEAQSLVRRLRPHASVALWCGGNELFNAWSKMTDQSLALRLLNSICYRLDPSRPFLPTSPVAGVGHGHYVFRDPRNGEECWGVFQRANNTAYCEFGIASCANENTLRQILPEDELFPPRPGGAWEAHGAYGVWMPSSHLHLEALEHYFGGIGDSLEQLVERSQLLQSEGLKGLFEEARRQKPAASMALSWCLNEPWPTAANGSLIDWFGQPKPALKAVGQACRPLATSARISKFLWQEGEVFDPQLWWLNDIDKTIPELGPLEAWIENDHGRRWDLLTWNGQSLNPNTNLQGPQLHWPLPALNTERFTLVLHAPQHPEADSRYVLLFRARPMDKNNESVMNLI